MQNTTQCFASLTKEMDAKQCVQDGWMQVA